MTNAFIVNLLARVFGKIDAEPRNGAQIVEVGLSEVSLFACKAVNFGTMGNEVNKGKCEETSRKLTLVPFLPKIRSS